VLCMEGELRTGELVAFYLLLGLLITPLMGLIGVWNKLQEIRLSFESMNDIFRLPVEPELSAETLPEIVGAVRFDHVYFRYDGGEHDILSDVTLTVAPGQTVACVGPSGSGKTTLAKLLMRLYEPTSGKIFIDERDIAYCDLGSLRRQIGVVEQLPFLFSGTVRENITKAVPDARAERVEAAARLAGAHEFIVRLPQGYDTPIGENGATLSGGQRQRLIIARALITDPRILILDEATAALDTESEKVVQKNLDVAMAGRTTFIIAHRLSTIRDADLIVVLETGRIVETGTHDELMARRGLYYDLVTKTPGTSAPN
jgi:ABC-type multidrug transport system fused ATPase/permease subunit